MRVAIVTSGYMPLPAVLGGAVECLDEFLVQENEIEHKCDLVVFSAYNEEAKNRAVKLCNTEVVFIKTPKVLNWGDSVIYHIVKALKPQAKTMSFRYILKRIHFIYKVAYYLKKNDYDRVVLENHATILLPMKLNKNYIKYNGRFVYHQHNEQMKFYGCEKILPYCMKVLTVSDYIANSIKSKIPELRDDQVSVWKNCVDSNRFGTKDAAEKGMQIRQTLGIKDEEKVVLYTGRVSPEKGVKELLMAFNKIKKDNLRLVIAGGYLNGDTTTVNAYENDIKQLANQIGEAVIITGFIEYEHIPGLYMMSQVTVIPSIIKNDAAPLTVVEAITSGCPLITTKSGGIPEYANEDCAFILDINDRLVDNIANSIIKIVDDDNLQAEMHNNAIETSMTWTVSNYYNRFVDYLKLL